MNDYQQDKTNLTGEAPERDRKKKWKNRLIWLACLAVPLLEMQIVPLLYRWEIYLTTTEVILWVTAAGLVVGAWAWILAKERLPDYCDQNRITLYWKDIIHLRIPGLAFNNRNWPHVLRAVRVWSVVMSVLPLTFSLTVGNLFWWLQMDAYSLAPILCPASLILPVVFLARWYELEEQPPHDLEERATEEKPQPISDYQVDKARLGEFIAGGRKRLGLTQKELAQRLYISDKAVSKWERGLSIPDVGLLIPLAELLGVTVTELLEGRSIRSEDGKGMEMREVEQVVKKALSINGEATAVNRVGKRRHRLIWAGVTLAALFELWVMFWFMRPIPESTWVLVLLAVIFGGWAWMGAKDRLPAYYDQNRISFYSDGIFKIHMGGLAFNNRNWPHILRAIRVWSIAAAVLPQPLSFLGGLVFRGGWFLWERLILLPLFLVGLFLPVYIVGRRYEKEDPAEK